MSRIRQQAAFFSDWESLHHENMTWWGTPKAFAGTSLPVPGPFVNVLGCTFATDVGDGLAAAARLGGAIPKPTIARPAAASALAQDVGYIFAVKIPDFIIMKQGGRFAEWTALRGTTDDDKMGDGGRRIGLQIENVLTSRSGATIGSNLTGFSACCKPRGFGWPTTDSPAVQTQDAPIGSNYLGGTTTPDLTANPPTVGTFGGANTSAFEDLSLPSDTPSDLDTANTAPTFSPDGVCRIQTIFEMPETVVPGTMLDIIIGIRVPVSAASPANIAVQWPYAAMRWIKGGPNASYPFLPNSSRQLVGTGDDEEAQPYDDADVENP